MNLSPLHILRPNSVEQACALLAEYQDDAIVYAGGTELLLAMKMGLADYSVLIDLKGLADLDYVVIGDGEFRVGATVTHRALERHDELAELMPSFTAMEGGLANPRVRATGTLAGNLCFGEPHSDPATYLMAAGAELLCEGPRGSRHVSAEEFLLGPFETVLQPGEILREVRVRLPNPYQAVAHERFVLTERPLVTATAVTEVRDSALSSVRIAVGAATPTPVRLHALEDQLLGMTPEQAGRQIAALARATTERIPLSEPEVDEAYLRHMVGVLVSRAVRRCMSRWL